MFDQSRCPNTACEMLADTAPKFIHRNGSYCSKVKLHPIHRFLCKSRRSGFSRQTFRNDYRDKKPDLNVAVYESLCSGVGYRQSTRHIDRTQEKFTDRARKISGR